MRLRRRVHRRRVRVVQRVELRVRLLLGQHLQRAIAGDVRNSLAFAMMSSLVDAGANDAVTLVRTAGIVRLLKNDAAAHQWLLSHLQPGDLFSTAREMYRQGQDVPLWEALPDPLPASIMDWVWLLRAASARRFPTPARSEALARHFASPQGTESYVIGRYITGLADESALKTAARRTSVAWALGIRAESDGRKDDAIAWYGLAVGGGDWKEPERGFAGQRLARWATEAREATADD